MDVVRTMHFTTNAERKMTIAEARRILVPAILTFENYVNSYRELRPFLIAYPFPMDQLSIGIIMEFDKYSGSNPDKLGSVDYTAGKLIYYENQAPNGRMVEIHSESFEEALKIVQKEAPDVLLQVAVKVYIPPKKSWFSFGSFFSNNKREKYYGPDITRKMKWNLDAYGERIAKKYGMTFHRAGNPTTISYNNVPYGLDIFDDHMITLEEGRILGATIFKDFLHYLQSTPIINEYHAYRTEKFKKWKGFPAFTAKPEGHQVCLKIGYWDQKFDRPAAPLLAEILYVEGYANYYETDPATQALKLVYREPYEDALKFLEAQPPAP
jgi:hypothetical protein